MHSVHNIASQAGPGQVPSTMPISTVIRCVANAGKRVLSGRVAGRRVADGRGTLYVLLVGANMAMWQIMMDQAALMANLKCSTNNQQMLAAFEQVLRQALAGSGIAQN